MRNTQIIRKRLDIVNALRDNPNITIPVVAKDVLAYAANEYIRVDPVSDSRFEYIGANWGSVHRDERFEIEVTVVVKSNDDAEMSAVRLAELVDIIDEMFLSDSGELNYGPSNNNGVEVQGWKTDLHNAAEAPAWEATITLVVELPLRG